MIRFLLPTGAASHVVREYAANISPYWRLEIAFSQIVLRSILCEDK